jgi:hypothetical protein
MDKQKVSGEEKLIINNLSHKHKWVVDRLFRRGYRWLGGSDSHSGYGYDPVVHLWRPDPTQQYTKTFDWSLVTITVDGSSYQQEAKFRPAAHSWIHVKAVLRLHQKDWSDLDFFEAQADRFRHSLEV